LAVLERRKPDRVPFDLGGTDCSSIHAVAYRRLREAMGLPTGPIPCACLMQFNVEVEEDVRAALGVDAEMLRFAPKVTRVWQAPFGVDLIVPDGFRPERQPDGSWTMSRGGRGTSARMAVDAHYFDPDGFPMPHVTSPAELDAYDELFAHWDYSSIYDEPLDALGERARKQYEGTDRAVVAIWQLHFLQAGQLMRGYDQFLMDLMTAKDLAHAILAKLLDVYVARIDRLLEATGPYFDVVLLTDDLGTQKAGMLSPTLYREMIYPYISQVVAKIKAAGKKIVMHSCGAVSAFVPFLIGMGVDALNPIQVSAEGMDPADLVREYGRDIAFWGGGIDTQSALCADNPDTVCTDVRKRLERFGPDASWIFTQVHNIQYDVPPRNILAMHETFCQATR
jgi:uroporphyrinogen decarboxylase